MSDDGDVVSRGPSDRATVTSLLLDVGHDGTFGHGAEREDVADAEGGFLSGVDELSGVHAFVGDETIFPHPYLCQPKKTSLRQEYRKKWIVVRLVAELVAVRVTEDNLSEGSSTTRVVDNFLHDTTDVPMTLAVIEGSEFGRVLLAVGVSSVICSKAEFRDWGRMSGPSAAWCWQLFTKLAKIHLPRGSMGGTY